MKKLAQACVLSVTLCCGLAHANLFEDEEARRAILELRQRVDALKQAQQQAQQQLEEQSAQGKRAVLELQNQLEILKSEISGLRGEKERLTREISELQRGQRDFLKPFEERFQKTESRLQQLEPTKVTLDGIEFMAEPAEKKEFDGALELFRKGDFAQAGKSFVELLKRYPQSGYRPAALFWLGNAQYATRDYKEAVTNFKQLITAYASHARAPEAMLSMANSQIELKDNKAAKKTLDDLLKAYPGTEAASAGKERLARLK